MMNLTQWTNKLWAGYITNFTIDLKTHSICMIVETVDNNERIQTEVIFHGVSSFHYFHDQGERRFDPIHWENIELSEFIYSPETEKTRHLSTLDNSEYISNPNFIMSLWLSAMYIEAKAISFNGELFEVGYL